MTCEEDWKSIRVVSEVLSLKKHALAYIRAETFIKKVNHRWNHMLISCEDFVGPAEYTRRPYIRLSSYILAAVSHFRSGTRTKRP